MQYTGFLFDGETYVHRRLPFGLKISTGRVTREFKTKLQRIKSNKIIIYIDEVVIFTETREENLQILRQVLMEIDKMNVRVTLKKTQLVKEKIKFLGHTFKEHIIMMNEETKKNIIEFPTPSNKKKLQGFIGLANWDRRFIPELASILKPLNQLLKKDQKFIWTEEQEKAFLEVKRAFQKANKLFTIQEDWKFVVQTDASLSGVGARLYQVNGEEQNTIAYASRMLKDTEIKYTTTEIEALAVLYAVNKWRVWLYGRPIKVETDHMALTFLLLCRLSNARITRWILELTQFNIEWKPIEGRHNLLADTLSRLTENKKTTENIVEIRQFKQNCDEWARLRTKIIKEQEEESKIAKSNKYDQCEIQTDPDGLKRIRIQNDWKIILPKTIIDIVIKKVHIFLLHAGDRKLIAFMSAHFAGEGIHNRCKLRSKSCDLCQRTKYYTKRTEGKFNIELPSEPNQQWSVEIFGSLVTSNFKKSEKKGMHSGVSKKENRKLERRKKERKKRKGKKKRRKKRTKVQISGS